jgi:hypothetical protein
VNELRRKATTFAAPSRDENGNIIYNQTRNVRQLDLFTGEGNGKTEGVSGGENGSSGGVSVGGRDAAARSAAAETAALRWNASFVVFFVAQPQFDASQPPRRRRSVRNPRQKNATFPSRFFIQTTARAALGFRPISTGVFRWLSCRPKPRLI